MKKAQFTSPFALKHDTGNNSFTAGCVQGGITPACIYDLYNIPADIRATQKSNSLGVSGFIEQFANQGDLQVRLRVLYACLVRC